MKEFFSKNLAIIITIIVLIAIVVGAIVLKLVLDNKNKKEEETKIETAITNYLNAMNTFETDKVLNTIDMKAACAYEKSKGDLSKFNKTYEELTDEDVENYKSDRESELTTYIGFYKGYLDSFKLELKEVSEKSEVPEVKGMTKVKVKVVTKFSYQGTEMNNENEEYFYIYNDKVVYEELIEEAAEEENDAEKTEDRTNESGESTDNTEKDAEEKPAA